MMQKNRYLFSVKAAAIVLMAGSVPTTSLADETANSMVPDAQMRSRIITIGGPVTETVHALGLEERIVAVDTTSVYPVNLLKDKPNVGYMRALSAEGVLSLTPSMILAIDGAGPAEVVKVLQSASVPLKSIPTARSEEGVVCKIRLIANIMGVPGKGETLIASVQKDFSSLSELTSTLAKRKRVMFVLSVRSGKIVASGRNTAAAGMIALAGADNALSEFEGYKPLSDEALINAAPDVILMMNRSGHEGGPEDVLALPTVSATPAGQSRSILKIDGAYLLGFGPRTAGAALELAHRLYPSLAKSRKGPPTSERVN